MAFDISKLTGVVNKYLFSISDVAKVLEKYEGASEEEKFAAYMRDALTNQSLQTTAASDVAATSGTSSASAVAAATSGTSSASAVAAVDNARQTQSAGTGLASRSVQEVEAVRDDRADRYNLAYSIRDNIEAHMRVDNTFKTESSTGSNLDVKQLQDLARSGYYSSGLVQSSLFDTGDNDDDDNSLNADGLASALKGTAVASSASNASLAFSTGTGASAAIPSASINSLLAAYKGNNLASEVTSVFGDFTL